MTTATRPQACQQWAAIGTCRLLDIPGKPVVDIIATASDLSTDRRFYVVRSEAGKPPFGVWPEETESAQWSQSLPRKPQFFLGT